MLPSGWALSRFLASEGEHTGHSEDDEEAR